MKIRTLEVGGLRPAMIAMRLPMKSGNKSDSGECHNVNKERCGNELPDCDSDLPHCSGCIYYGDFTIGPKDHELSMKLIKASSDHRKHLRLIDVWVEIQAPLYFHKQLDTYRFGVDKESESTMHTLMKKPLSLSDFELPERDDPEADLYWNHEIYDHLQELEALRQAGDFEGLNALLPQSYLQTRIMKFSYEALRNIYHARKNHRLKQWHVFCDWIETLPYSEFITEPAS